MIFARPFIPLLLGAAAPSLTPVIWNAADTDGNVTVSGGGITATRTSGGGANGGVRGNIGKAAGKWYFEIHQGSTPWRDGSQTSVGIALLAMSLGSLEPGNDLGLSVGFSADAGRIKYNGANTSSNPDPGGFETAGQVFMCAFDGDAHKVWFGANGSWAGTSGSAGNPAAGTNECASGLSSSAWFPVANRAGEVGSTCDLYASAADCTYAAPSGFLYWGA